MLQGGAVEISRGGRLQWLCDARCHVSLCRDRSDGWHLHWWYSREWYLFHPGWSAVAIASLREKGIGTGGLVTATLRVGVFWVMVIAFFLLCDEGNHCQRESGTMYGLSGHSNPALWSAILKTSEVEIF